MTIAAVALLAAVLAVAVWRPRGLPEATAAVPAAAVVVVTGLLTPGQALDEAARLAPTVGFLAAVLVLAHLADAEEVFRWAAGLLAARPNAVTPARVFGRVFVIAAVTTAVLSLDATVVLLTPVVVTTARTLRQRPEPPAYVCAHLANSASLLLPVSNLTNLLAFDATRLDFLGFAAIMALPWLAVLAVEYAGLRWCFRRELGPPGAIGTNGAFAHIEGTNGAFVPNGDEAGVRAPLPRFAAATLAATLAGFAVASAVGVEPAWVALGGAVVLGARSLARRTSTPRTLVAAASPLFCLFVLALGVVVAAVTTHGLGPLVAGLLPGGDDLPALLAVAAVAAVLANVVNNLPATLVLLAAVGAHAPTATVLAVLIGVGVGPNLTYVGSLATLLWRRVLLARDVRADLGRFTVVGLATTPAALAAGTVALWAALQVL